MITEKAIYKTVASNDEEANESDEDLKEALIARASNSKLWSSRVRVVLPWLVHLVLLSASLFTFIASQKKPLQSQGDDSLFSHLIGDNKRHNVRFDGTTGPGGLYKGPPNSKLDEAWEKIFKIGIISVSQSEFDLLNASRYAVQHPPEIGGGYMALPEFVHQMHCLNMLFKHAYSDYYIEEWQAYEEDKEAWFRHINHCTEGLRQKIFCDADMNLITYNWVRGYSTPMPNFNVQHTCRNFDVALKWTLERQVDPKNLKGDNITRPGGKTVVEYDVQPPFDPYVDH